MPRYPVAVVHVEDVEADVRRGIALLGGIERYVRPGALVLIKVNMFSRATPESARVTHPAVVLAVAKMCRQVGAQVKIIERSPHYDYILQDYPELAQVAELVAIEDLEQRLKHLPGAKSLVDQIPWTTLVDKCDVFINIPGLRTHALTKLSNGMKNLMGLMPEETTRYIHHYGLDGSICDLNAYRPSDLVITEALYTLEGNFPSEGTPVKTDLITVADNVVAADLVAAKIVGLDPKEIFYLQEAIARGMGPAGLEEIELLGDDLDEILSQFTIEPAPRDPELYRGNFTLYIEHACDSCRQALAGGLLAASHRPELAEMKGISIIAGYQDQPPAVGNDRVLIYGNCAYRYRHLGHYEPGCPPLAYQVIKGLTALKRQTIRPAMCSIAWREASIESVLPHIAQAGYLGVELWGPHIERYLQEGGSLSSLAALLEEHALQVPMISTYFDLINEPEESLSRAKRYIEYAQALEAPLIRVFTGGGDSDQAPVSTWRAVVKGLREICRLGLDHQIGFALETHRGHLHDTTESTLKLIRQVGAQNLWVNLDIFNLFTKGEDPLQALKRLFPWVRILHLKNGLRQGEKWQSGIPLAKGAMDYGSFLQALSESNYGGYVSIEWFGEDPAQAAQEELAYLQEHLENLEVRK